MPKNVRWLRTWERRFRSNLLAVDWHSGAAIWHIGPKQAMRAAGIHCASASSQNQMFPIQHKDEDPQALLEHTEFVAFDLETTGLHPVFARIVEIGAVRFRGDGTVLDQFSQLVDPRCRIPADATAVHGITDPMVAGQPVIADVLPRLCEFIGSPQSVLLAHNAAFDVGFLSVAFGRCRQACPDHEVFDTCRLARRRTPLPNYKLETLGRHLQLIDREEHRALGDSLLLQDVFLHLVRQAPAITCTDELCRFSPALRFDSLAGLLQTPPTGYEDLWQAIAEQRPVEMQYEGGSSPGAMRRITPLGVTQMRGHVYLSALCHRSESEKTFRLDRIAAYRLPN